MPHKKGPLSGTTALVTGAPSPLGQAIVFRLVRDGADIVLQYHKNREAANKLYRAVLDDGGKAWMIRADFSRLRDIESLLDKALNLASRVDFLINNASIFPSGTIATLPYEGFARTARINAWAPIVVSRDFAKQGRRGAIVNLLDSRIVGGDPGHAGYMLSKHLLAEATMLMAIEYAPRIRVNAVAPGLVLKSEKDRSGFRRLSRRLPLQKCATPHDIADAVAFLVENPSMTGQTIYVDNGRQVREIVRSTR